ncbi:MAG TPA: hypothetical protein VJB57_07015 [Dehalococcoidia bacterium]|nr:hypothetical protein [Dehalococcoidia bacterium]
MSVQAYAHVRETRVCQALIPRLHKRKGAMMVWAARRWSDMPAAERRALKGKVASERAERAFSRRSLLELESVTSALRQWGASDDEIADILDCAFRKRPWENVPVPARLPARPRLRGYSPRRAAALVGLGLVLVSALQASSPAESTPNSLSILGQQCLPGGGVEATVAWLGNNPAAGQQRVDISLANNGWLPGTFAASSPLSPGQNWMTMTGLGPGVAYHLRVSQQLANGWWDTSQTFTYTTPAYCSVVIAQPTVIIRRVTQSQASEVLGATSSSSSAAASTAGWSASADVAGRTLRRGARADLGVTVRRTTTATGLINVEIHGPGGGVVFQKFYDSAVVSGNGFRAFTMQWAIPANATPGTYTVKVGVFTPGWGKLLYWNNSAATFVVN